MGAGAEQVIADRYRVVRELGRGGMAVAYQVEDLAKGETLALKQLIERTDKASAEVSLLFEQEYHSLCQLAHPCVVEVKDFDRDAAGVAFYTMELLQGDDLRKVAPMPQERVCALLRDVCSALSLLHSRRLLHRDLTPRNVYCLPDGKTKLIDFGAVAPFGPSRRIIGTPAYCAPEVLARQELDGRSDLYALGATAYFALTGRNAFHARTFAELQDAWRSPPKPPSRLVPGVPPALDQLVMSLLQLDRAARPASAAEVMERACAIGGLDPSEQWVVPQAYLSTPRLVERDEALARVRKLLVRNLRGRGGRLLVSAEPRMGRSRFLSACALEGKLLGAVVLCIDASDARRGPFSAARELVCQLLEALPALAGGLTLEQRALLNDVWPEMLARDADGSERERASSPSSARPSSDLLSSARPRLQIALQELLLAASRVRPLLLVVDDLPQLDEPSAALLSLLAEAAPAQRVALLASAERGALADANGAVAMFAQAAGLIKMRPLTEQGTFALLASIFGEVPNLRLLADRLHRISGGAPGGLMDLAQHLLQRGILRYQAGAFWLPSELREEDLPASVGEALELTLGALTPGALRLAQALALASGLQITLEDLRALSGQADRALLGDVDLLIAQDVIDVRSGGYALRHRGLEKPLLARLSDADKRALHLQLADLLARRDPLAQSVIQQLFEAGELERATDLVIERHRAIEQRTVEEITAAARELGRGFQQRFRALADHCNDIGRPRRDRMAVLSSLVGYSALIAGDGFSNFEDLYALIEQAAHDCGLDIYAELADVPQAERLGRALQLAQQRYEQTPEHDRVWAPVEAIRALARCVVQSIGVFGGRQDPDLYATVPSLAPLVSLSPALWVIHENFLGATQLGAGRMHRARERLAAVLERMGPPGSVAGEDAHLTYMRLAVRFAMCSGAVTFGQAPPQGYLESLERDPIFEVNAARLRMVLALRRGDSRSADEQRHRAELLRVQNSPPQMFEGAHLTTEYTSYVFYGDLARIKQVLPQLEDKARRILGWRPMLHHARGEYQRLRGDLPRALDELSTAFELVAEARHSVFCGVAASMVTVLRQMGRCEEASDRGETWIAQAEQADFGPAVHVLYEAVALAHAESGRGERADELAKRAVAVLEQIGAAGVLLGGAHETAARVALWLGELERFHEHAERCAQHYAIRSNSMLAARYAALLKLARRDPELPEPQDGAAGEARRSAMELVLTQCHSPRDRAERALEAIVEQLGCDGGFLYAMKLTGPELVAQIGPYTPPSELDTQVAQYLGAEIDGASEVTLTVADLAIAEGNGTSAGWPAPDGGRYYPSLLAHQGPTGLEITGLVALRHSDPQRARLQPELGAAISRALRDAGDVPTVLAAS